MGLTAWVGPQGVFSTGDAAHIFGSGSVPQGKPFWIKKDSDWKICTDYGVNSYSEALQAWRKAADDGTDGVCFWIAHGAECSNKRCPICPRK